MITVPTTYSSYVYQSNNVSSIQANNLDGTIELIKGKVEEVTLPDGIEKVSFDLYRYL